ncbi:MAG: putative two component transcriptional regulator, winged helix family [Bacteroidetes bacterium]|jgi:DNA-binding response OmpR family regulator|nr:putative two component transcriptional regulator, winged helix family [Bacteroidota bacterium]
MKIETEKLVLIGLDENLKALMSVPSYKIGAYTFDVETRQLIYKNESVKLTGKESYLLVLLAANSNSFLERKYILTTIWKEDNFRTSRSMDVYICKLRKLLGKDNNINIVNIHGKGHKLIITNL